MVHDTESIRVSIKVKLVHDANSQDEVVLYVPLSEVSKFNALLSTVARKNWESLKVDFDKENTYSIVGFKKPQKIGRWINVEFE